MNKNIKRIIILILVFAMTFTVTSCSRKNKGIDDDVGYSLPDSFGSKTKSSETEYSSSRSGSDVDGEGDAVSSLPADAPEQRIPIKKSATLPKIKITATDIKTTTGTDFSPGIGNVYVCVKYTVENISDSKITVNPQILFDAVHDGLKGRFSYNSAAAFNTKADDIDILPGKTAEGYYTSEIPKKTTTFELRVKPTWLSTTKTTFAFPIKK